MSAPDEFEDRLLNEWLPTYCNDPKRCYEIAGFDRGSLTVAKEDARDFLRAIDEGIVVDSGGGRFVAPQSTVAETIFWEGSKTATPRPITLWLEPVITIASLARLHLDFGWPKALLGTQSEKWEFDFTAFMPNSLQREYVAGEVKKSVREVDALLKYMMTDECMRADNDGALSPARKNSYRKYQGLLRRHAPLFWAVGPGGFSRLFQVSYPPNDRIGFTEVAASHLRFQSGSSAQPAVQADGPAFGGPAA